MSNLLIKLMNLYSLSEDGDLFILTKLIYYHDLFDFPIPVETYSDLMFLTESKLNKTELRYIRQQLEMSLSDSCQSGNVVRSGFSVRWDKLIEIVEKEHIIIFDRKVEMNLFSENPDLNFVRSNCKISLIGDSGVGKTALFNSVMGDRSCHTEPTIGVDFTIRQIGIMRLTTYDTSGQWRFEEIVKQHVWNSDVIFSCFDDIGKIQSPKFWSKCNILVMTKCDVSPVDERKAAYEMEAYGYDGYILTSAKTGRNVHMLEKIIFNLSESNKVGLWFNHKKFGETKIKDIMQRKGVPLRDVENHEICCSIL